MQRLIKAFNCQESELLAKIKEFRELLKMDPYKFGELIGFGSGAAYAVLEDGAYPIEVLTKHPKAVDALVELLNKHPEHQPGYDPKDAAFNKMEELIDNQRKVDTELNALFVRQAIAAIKLDDKPALQRLIGIATTTGLPYQHFLKAVHNQSE